MASVKVDELDQYGQSVHEWFGIYEEIGLSFGFGSPDPVKNLIETAIRNGDSEGKFDVTNDFDGSVHHYMWQRY